MTMRKVLVAAAAVAVSFAGRARAAQEQSASVSKEAEPEEHRWSPQFRISVDSGVSDFKRDLDTEVGPAYGVTLGFYPLQFAGIEVSYQGSVNSVTPPTSGGSLSQAGFDRVLSNGVLGDLRVGAPLRVIEPYVFGGAGWLRVSEQGAGSLPDRDTDSLAVPVGGGVDVHVTKRFQVGGRFTYDFLTSNDIPGASNVNLWQATLSVGGTIQ
jgi:opacity protein-like surface antigen